VTRRRPAATGVALLAVLLLAVPAATDAQAPGSVPRPADRGSNAITAPPALDRVPRGYARTGLEVSRTAGRVPKVRRARAGRRNTYARPYLKGPPALRRWQVSFYAPGAKPGDPADEIAQVLVDDRTGRVREAWTGFQVAWTMARGYDGAFGRKANDPVVWIVLSVLFVLPFAAGPCACCTSTSSSC
jgi:hypothetical protein